VWADTVASATRELQRHSMPVLIDLSRGVAALQSAQDLRAHHAAALLFAIVDARRPDVTTEAILAGMADVFPRPLGGRRVANAIERELEYDARRDGNGNGHGNGDSGDLYELSPAMRELLTSIARAASTRAGVLIRGEQGTGRQIAARAVHAEQHGSAGRFVAIDCAAHDGDELDAALFGVAATPGGDAGRDLERISAASRVYQARGGTLYLQNVAEAPTRVQARLARVLRDREGVVAETGNAMGFDVRPMAGVDPAVDGAAQEGRVRDDLFRRLSVIRLDMPPLRSRREDIPALANYFVRDICASLGMPPKTLSRPVVALLSALPWRGNASELRALLEAVVAGLNGSRTVCLESLLAHVRLDNGSTVLANAGTLKQARSRFEREYIAGVLEQHRGRISEAAKALGIQRTNLYRKMRSLRVSRNRKP
jgi:two-component system, NtrC family, nitrogen regulation response regulator NtrX